jgi:hypothetical protein
LWGFGIRVLDFTNSDMRGGEVRGCNRRGTGRGRRRREEGGGSAWTWGNHDRTNLTYGTTASHLVVQVRVVEVRVALVALYWRWYWRDQEVDIPKVPKQCSSNKKHACNVWHCHSGNF